MQIISKELHQEQTSLSGTGATCQGIKIIKHQTAERDKALEHTQSIQVLAFPSLTSHASTDVHAFLLHSDREILIYNIFGFQLRAIGICKTCYTSQRGV